MIKSQWELYEEWRSPLKSMFEIPVEIRAFFDIIPSFGVLKAFKVFKFAYPGGFVI